MSRWPLWVKCLAVVWLIGVRTGCAAEPAPSEAPVAKPGPNSPLSPEESLKQFQIDPDCRIELVAAEPDVSAPVSIAFDEKGQLWVVEMHDYPNGPAPGQPGKSRIRVLTDEDGDGKFSNPTVFVDQLLFANSLMHWDGGVLVTTDGKLIYFKDTDHDGKSDLREVWFEGFATENPQLRCNHPTFGPDNWIYVANGLRNGKVKAVRPKWPQPAPESAKLGEPVDIAGRDFRFNPFTGECEAVSGYGQFGLTFDDEGNRYVCSNRNPCMKIIIEERHLKLNPNLAVPSVYEDVSPAGEKSKLYPISRAWTTSNLHAGQFSAACGLIIYRGGALPQYFYGQNFTCDPTGNLVHCDYDLWSLRNEDEHREGQEFLASDETWFRPVNTALGPDGALYIVDMYRAVIEHPDYMPTELKTRPDLTVGSDRGRIWRIVGKTPIGEPDRIESSMTFPWTTVPFPTDPEVIATLVEYPNAWHRDTAQRLLVEKHAVEAEQMLRHILAKKPSDQGSVVALRTLHGLGLLQAKDLSDIIQREVLDLPDLSKVEHHGQRVHGQASRLTHEAVRLAEYYVATDTELRRQLIQLGFREESDSLANQLHLTLGQLEDRYREDRVALTIDDLINDHVTATSVAMGERAFLAEILNAVIDRRISSVSEDSHYRSGYVYLHDAGFNGALPIEATIRGATPEEVTQIFGRLVKLRLVPDILEAAKAMQGRGIMVNGVISHSPELAGDWKIFLDGLVNVCTTGNVPDDKLAAAVPCLRFGDSALVLPALRQILSRTIHNGNSPTEVDRAVLETVAAFPDQEASDLLFDGFERRTPVLRSVVITALLASEPRITKLLDLVESNQISFLEIGQTRLTSLQQVKNPEIQARLTKLIVANAPADRSKVLEEYQAALTHEHNPLRGRELFAKNCAQCHKIGDLGVDVAPNISDSRVKTQAQLLVDILDPNRAIDNNYFSYTLVDTAGTVATGIISSETSSSVTMKQPEGKTITVLRSEIEQLKPNGVSLMPVGFEKQLTVAQMADVISFIKNWRYLDGQVPKEVIK